MDVYDGYNERLSRVLATIPNPGHPRDARPKIDVEAALPGNPPCYGIRAGIQEETHWRKTIYRNRHEIRVALSFERDFFTGMHLRRDCWRS